MTSVLYAGSHLPESLLGHLVQLFSAQAKIVTLICTQHLLQDVQVIRGVLLSLRAVNKPLDLMVGNKTHPQAINMTVFLIIYLDIYTRIFLYVYIYDRQSTHPLVDFRVPSAAVGDPVLNNSACKCAAAF